MKEKIFNTCIILISLFVLGELLINKNIVYSSILYALNLWVNTLIPALFPFFIISDILINYNIINYIPNYIKKICKKVFGINDTMLTILLLSMISGFPSNARNTRIMYDNGKIDVEEANHILIYTHFANPVFILTTVSIFFFHNESIGWLLLISHYLSNFILGLLFRNKYGYIDKTVINNYGHNFGEIFVLAIKKAIDTILNICGIVTVFLMISSLIINTFNIDGYNQMIVKSIFEITIGLEELSKLSLRSRYTYVLASMILGFGGISVHIQVLSQIIGTKIKYIYFFIGRMYQMILSGILTYVGCIILRI